MLCLYIMQKGGIVGDQRFDRQNMQMARMEDDLCPNTGILTQLGNEMIPDIAGNNRGR